MTEDQFMSVLRGILNLVGGSLVSSGIISGGNLTTIVGIVLGIAMLAWGAFVHTDASTIKASEAVIAKKADL